MDLEESIQRNEQWRRKVHECFWKGYGVEDIAVMLKCEVTAVRNELAILTRNGKIHDVLKGIIK